MGRYTIEISKEALADLLKIKKSGKTTDISKIEKIFLELEIHPTIGIGKPEKLKYKETEIWSRQINKKDRLVYEIIDHEVVIIIISALGHYNDK
ncbi:Txe/YoeB family addiction module toxin [Flavobacterium granuli]|uniref:Putative mRNA interferase YoeB n=1 Tax=Flavobacterium granuli TaxID=280093 RepID=A0A1M5MJU1_9FLAO|nr:Txe/YoeB family addiction module toxin [Flavobacterium granuli]PRZ24974.1 toxin YoeB [Flavobacterium granuli]SHG77372.1 toxin YoeB [Flavobacterium granuli]